MCFAVSYLVTPPTLALRLFKIRVKWAEIVFASVKLTNYGVHRVVPYTLIAVSFLVTPPTIIDEQHAIVRFSKNETRIIANNFFLYVLIFIKFKT